MQMQSQERRKDTCKEEENKVPAIKDDATALIKSKTTNAGKSRPNASKTTVFPRPSLKKGTVRGRNISAYENRRVSAPR